jgi:cytochrome c oxidase subunit IV
MDDDRPSTRGRTAALGALVFFGGFAVMVLEIVGARYLQPWFGSAFYVWVSQIGVVMMALAMGYAVGGKMADSWKRAQYLAALLIPAAVFILIIPNFAPTILDAIVDRHAQTAEAGTATEEPPADEESDLLSGLDPEFLQGSETNGLPPPPEPEDQGAAEVPAIWKKLDPAIGSAVVFLLPCFALAMISPYMIRIAAQQVSRIGTVSGLVYSASTVGSIGGVFVTAYVLIEYFSNNTIFYLTGGLTLGLAGLCFLIEWLWPETLQDE